MPSSGQSATSSTLAGPPISPLTRTVILHAHLCLLLLQAPGVVMPQTEAKDKLSAVIKSRGWDEQDPRSLVFGLVGKKTLVIDRKAGGGPSGMLLIS